MSNEPGGPELISLRELARRLVAEGVLDRMSHQRVSQISREDPAFPPVLIVGRSKAVDWHKAESYFRGRTTQQGRRNDLKPPGETMPNAAVPQTPVCPCCTFGNHTEICTCDGSSCCHSAEHGAQRDRLHRQLVAARAEADGLAEAMRNADRLYGQHLAEERAKATTARVAALGEAAAAIQDVIDRNRAEFPARSNDRAALGGARELVLGLIGRRTEDEPRGEDR